MREVNSVGVEEDHIRFDRWLEQWPSICVYHCAHQRERRLGERSSCNDGVAGRARKRREPPAQELAERLRHGQRFAGGRGQPRAFERTADLEGEEWVSVR